MSNFDRHGDDDDGKPREPRRFEVVVVGGGPGGLSAALVLGRARRHVLVCDGGEYRNASSRALHGFITRDGTPPSEFLEIARGDLARYDNVHIERRQVVAATRVDAGFEVTLDDSTRVSARKIILATGVVDELPSIEGVAELLGRGVYHCPYCDGWEVRDLPLAVYGRGDEKGAGMALELTQWSRDLLLCTDGPSGISAEYRARLGALHIPILETPIVKVERSDQDISISFCDGTVMIRHALFFNTGRHQRSDLARTLGCTEWAREGCRLEGKSGKTSVAGVYIVGDASRDALQVVVAAGEGSEAAIAVNVELLRDSGIL